MAFSLDWSPDGSVLAIGGVDRTLVFSVAKRKLVRRLRAGRGHNKVTFLPDGQLVSIGNSENNSYVWNPRTNKTTRYTGIVACARYYADAWSCERPNRRARVHYTTGGTTRFTVKLHTATRRTLLWKAEERSWPPYVMSLTNGGQLLLVAGGPTYSRTQTQRVIMHSGGLRKGRATFFKRVPKLTNGGSIRYYVRGRFNCERTGVAGAIISLGPRRHSRRFLTGHKDGFVGVFDRCKLRRLIRHGRTKVVGVAHDPTGHRGASVDASGKLCLWKLSTGAKIACTQLR